MNFIPKSLRFRPRRRELPGGRTVRVSPLVRASVHDGGLALLNIRSGQIFLCNRTGSRIWQGLLDGRTPQEVADEISNAYGVGRALAEQHTFSFVGELERRGLVTQ